MLRILDVSRSRQLIAALSVFPAALPVPLAGDRSITAAGFPDTARGQYKVDVGEDVLDSF